MVQKLFSSTSRGTKMRSRGFPGYRGASMSTKATVLILLAVALLLPWTIEAQTVYDTVPITYDFENTTDNAHWTFVSGNCYNSFVADTGANTTTNGSRSMHVTQSDAYPYTPYTYKSGSGTAGDQTEVQSRTFVYRDIFFPDSGDYDIGYWWNCFGETIYDYGRIALAPATWVFNASLTAWDSTTSVSGEYWGSTSIPSSFICLDNGHPLSGVNAPQYFTKTFHIDSAGLYRLVMQWNNDGNTGDQPPLMIDDLQIRFHGCPFPSNLRAYDLSQTNFKLSWDSETNVSSWTVMYDTCGGNAFTTHNVTTNHDSIGGLTAGGVYDVLVRANCSGSTQSIAAFYRVTLPTCENITALPYSYPLDSASTFGSSSIPPVLPCWTHINSAASSTAKGYPYLTSNSTYAHNGYHAFYFYYTTTNNYDRGCGFALPGLDRNQINLQHAVVKFWAASSSTSYSPRLVVGMMTDPTNTATFDVLDTISGLTTTVTEYVIPLSSYTGLGNYVAIRQTDPSSGTYAYCYVSDITIADESCPRPVVVLDSMTGTEAYISWNNVGALSYEIATSYADQTTPETQTDTTYALNNLQPNTSYTVYVRSNCGTAMGEWTAFTFRTPCMPLSTYPWTDDFDTYTAGTGLVPSCWTFLNDATGTYANYPYVYNYTNYAHSGSQMVYFMLYPLSSTGTSYANYEMIVLPDIDTSVIPLNRLRLSFWHRTSSTSYKHWMKVGVMTNKEDATTFLPLDSVYIDKTSYQFYQIDLDSCPSGYSYIALREERQPYSYTYSYIDDITIDRIPDCRRVEDFIATNITTTSAEFSWTPTDGAEEWDVVYGFEGFDPEDSVAFNVYDTTFSISTGLLPDTTYDIYITPVCTGLAETYLYTFRTPCTLIDTMPYFNGFEAYPLNTTTTRMDIPCWSYLTDATTTFYPFIGSTANTNHSGERGINWYFSSTSANYGSYQILAMPAINSTNYNMQNLTVKFYAHPPSLNYVSTLAVGVMSNAADPESFVPCQIVSLDVNTAWREYSVSLSNYNGDGNIVAFKSVVVEGGSTYWQLFMDDITIEWSPCPTPIADVTSITSDSAYLSWGGTASAYQYEVVANGDSLTGAITTTTSNSANIGELHGNTSYTFYLRAICNNDTSEWSQASFRTACGTIDTLPYFNGFEEEVIGSSTNNNFIRCWYRTTPQASYYYPYVSSSTTYAHSGTKGLYWGNISSVGSYPAYMDVVLPEINTSISMSNLSLSFWAKPSSASYSPWFLIGVMDDPTNDSTFTTVDTVFVANNVEWQQFEVLFSNYTGTGHYPAIKAVQGTTSYCYVDDIMLTEMGPCSHPISVGADYITATSADISWTSLCNAPNFVIEYSHDGITQTTTSNTTSTTLTNLVPNTNYEVVVRSICSSNDTSDASIGCTFRTGCVPIDSIPWIESFDEQPIGAQASPFLAYCWQRNTDAVSYPGCPYVQNSTTYAHTGTKGLYWYISNSTSYSLYGSYNTIILPELSSNIAIDTLQLSFWARKNSASYTNPQWAIGVMSDPSDINTFVALDTVFVDDTAGTSWVQYSVPLNGYMDTGRFVAIQSYYTGSYTYASVDDIELNYRPECVRPTGLQASNITHNSATLTWGSSGNSYRIHYRAINDTSYTTITDSTNSIVITGLSNVTTYYWYVEAICNNDTLVSAIANFSTPLCSNSMYAMLDTTGNQITTYQAPINNFYNYALTEIIVDGLELYGATELTSIAFNYSGATDMTRKNDIDIYLQPTTKESFASIGDIEDLDSTNAVLVYSGELNCTQGWNFITFNSIYHHDGQSNLMVIIDDNSGAMDGTGYTFYARSTTDSTSKTISWCSDNQHPALGDLSNFVGTKNLYTWRPEIQFIHCGPDCAMPYTYISTLGYDSAVVTIIDADRYEIELRTLGNVEFGETITDSSETFTFTGLQPSTGYQYRVRQVCGEESASSWVYINFYTDDLPCFAPEDLTATAIAGQTASFNWTAGTTTTSWQIRVYNTTFDQTYATDTPSYTIEGLASGVTYNASVRGLCGGGIDTSDWCEAISFTTESCDPVTDITTSDITGTSATVSWTAGENNTDNWEISWNYEGAGMNNPLGSQTVTTPSYVITGLTANTPYEIFVRAICGDNYTSGFSTASFTTQNVGIAHVENGMNLSIFPNPTTGNTTITLNGVSGNITLSIIDMSGRTIQSSTMECSGDCEKQLSVENLVAGAYFVRVYGDNVNTVKKLIVK